MKKITLIICAVLAFASCQQKEVVEDTLPMKVAKAYGFDNFDQVNSIAYTWNVQRDSINVFTRDWKWNLRENTVYYSGPDTTMTYSLDADSLPPVDRGFINDKYWMMYPFQLAWDTGYTWDSEENVASPIAGTNATRLTIVYNSEDGYTPGDAYDLYLDENYKILEWTFRKGNGPDGRTWTWENEQSFGPITMATDHKGQDGQRVIWFTNVKVD